MIFKNWDVVRLKSGSHEMTIVATYESSVPASVFFEKPAIKKPIGPNSREINVRVCVCIFCHSMITEMGSFPEFFWRLIPSEALEIITRPGVNIKSWNPKTYQNLTQQNNEF